MGLVANSRRGRDGGMDRVNCHYDRHLDGRRAARERALHGDTSSEATPRMEFDNGAEVTRAFDGLGGSPTSGACWATDGGALGLARWVEGSKP